MPIVQFTANNVASEINRSFFSPPKISKGNNSIYKHCQYLGKRILNKDEEKKQLKRFFPNFCYVYLDQWMFRHNPVAGDGWGTDDMHLLKNFRLWFFTFSRIDAQF